MRTNIFNIAKEEKSLEYSKPDVNYLKSYIAVLESKLFKTPAISLEGADEEGVDKYKVFLADTSQKLSEIESKANSLNHDKESPVTIECGSSFAVFKSCEDILDYMNERHKVTVKAQELQTEIIIANFNAVSKLFKQASTDSSFDNCAELIKDLDNTYLTPSIGDVTFNKVSEDDKSVTYQSRELFGNYVLKHSIIKHNPFNPNTALNIQPVTVVAKMEAVDKEATTTVTFGNMEVVTKFIAAVRDYIKAETELDNGSLLSKQTNAENKFYAELNKYFHLMEDHPLNGEKQTQVKNAINAILAAHSGTESTLPENTNKAFDEKFLKETVEMLMKLTETYFWGSK